MSEPTDVVYQRSCSPVTGVALVCSAHRITPRKPCSDRSALYLWRAVLQGGNSPGDARTFLHGFTASLTLEALWGGNRTYGSRTHPKEPLGSGAVGAGIRRQVRQRSRVVPLRSPRACTTSGPSIAAVTRWILTLT